MRHVALAAISYVATVLVVPIGVWALASVWPVSVPVPRGALFHNGLELYAINAALAAIVGLPGFLLGRFGLWWTGLTSPWSFALAGALTGYLATIALAFPVHLWVIRAYSVDILGSIIGAAAGVIFWQIEMRLAGVNPARGSVGSPKELAK